MAVFALALAGCGGSGEPVEPVGNTGSTGSTGSTGGTGGTGGGGGGGGSTSNQVTVQDNSYSPAATTVSTGTTVTWTWANGNYSDHNVTFDNTSLGASPTQLTGTYQKQFPTAGEFTYYCTVHGRGMSGTVTVQ
jgi:plastocyanin